MAKRYYELKVAGVTRSLPILNISDKLAIAGFVMLGDIELCEACAKALAKIVPQETEVLLTAETKGIAVGDMLARELGMKHYVVARKSIKAYMENVLTVEDESITTKGKQMLCLMDTDVALMKGKNVLLVDDVISTGGSIKALEELAEKAGARVIGRAAVLAEGSAKDRDDIIYLEALPLFEAE